MCAWDLEYFTHLTALKENNLPSHESLNWTYNFFFSDESLTSKIFKVF